MLLFYAMFLGENPRGLMLLLAAALLIAGGLSLRSPRQTLCFLIAGIVTLPFPDLIGLLVLAYVADTGGSGALGMAVVVIVSVLALAPLIFIGVWVLAARILRRFLPHPAPKAARYALGFAFFAGAIFVVVR